MLAMTKQTRIALAELVAIEIECADCHTGILLRVDGSPDVTECPCCHRNLDVKSGLTRLFGAFAALRESRHAVSFPVRE